MDSPIVTPLWKEIISFLHNDKETLKQVRLVCKLFRKFTLPFWKQVIFQQKLKEYFIQITNFNFDIGKLLILDESSNKPILEVNLYDKDINKCNEHQLTPLYIACENGFIEIVDL